ncbi:MAG: CPBP family intramembrane metalloprotease [Alphaproteobacteria bacterium]|nr:CPBP family intramembrane metalloprotease [Alphaproteobacteria bacterium]
MKHRWLWVECVALFALLPVVFWFLPLKPLLFLVLWVMGLGCLLLWMRMTKAGVGELWRGVPRQAWKPMLLRFAVCAPALLAFTAWHDPERLFSFPIERPGMWAVVMLLYPVLSVIPQEIVYRVFFCERYKALFAGRATLLMSGLAFGHAHLFLGNWVAYVFSAIGGVMFAQTYEKHRNFALIWVEHALYGCWVFTLGLGWYFYHGARG